MFVVPVHSCLQVSSHLLTHYTFLHQVNIWSQLHRAKPGHMSSWVSVLRHFSPLLSKDQWPISNWHECKVNLSQQQKRRWFESQIILGQGSSLEVLEHVGKLQLTCNYNICRLICRLHRLHDLGPNLAWTGSHIPEMNKSKQFLAQNLHMYLQLANPLCSGHGVTWTLRHCLIHRPRCASINRHSTWQLIEIHRFNCRSNCKIVDSIN